MVSSPNTQSGGDHRQQGGQQGGQQDGAKDNPGSFGNHPERDSEAGRKRGEPGKGGTT
ncbi:stress-induced acidophilic repeat motif-containing protein [Ancylobacter amanitiformis]|uniref:General stress protein YciG n=1 Tax=Ancylobacter amanitiformis TaxID=217069 RepID=A0ABU0LRA3_9HYPH|nr:stress-induced acidophilic repeat motif-containing protein [Ancylobacter amanitiformis]MDQ0511123.1 general stress protein YciG [Ancylobacter amanitiformis]